jgi:hypothetical protein
MLKIKITLIILCLELFFSSSILCQDRVFLCPGVKFGYAFGENDGFIYGIELSIVYHSNESNRKGIYGFVISIDKLNELNKLHLGVEHTMSDEDTNFLNGLGFEIGPTLVWDKYEKYLGCSLTAYHGFIIHPYFSFNFINKNVSFHELGAYIKIPVMMKGKPIRFGG